MNNTEIFLHCISAKEADLLLKYFKLNVKGGTLETKRNKLRGFFRQATPIKAKMRAKAIASPFISAINQYCVSAFKNMDEKTLLYFLNDFTTDKLSDCAKYSNLLYYYPEKTKLLGETFEENIRNNLPLFTNTIGTVSEDEVVQYYKSMSTLYNENELEDALTELTHYTKKETYDCYYKKKDEIGEWNLIDFHTKLKEYNNDAGFAIQLIFLKTKDNLPLEIKNVLYVQLLLTVISKFKNIALTEHHSETHSSDDKEEITELKHEIAELKRKQKSDLAKRKEFESELTQLRNSETKYNDEMEKQKSNYDNLINLLKSDVQRLHYEVNAKSEALSNSEKYFKSFYSEKRETPYLFAIICDNNNISLLRKIYPEIYFKVKCKIEDILTDPIMNQINVVYIQRECADSQELCKMVNLFRNNNIKYSLLPIPNAKFFIEKVALIKNEINKGEIDYGTIK